MRKAAVSNEDLLRLEKSLRRTLHSVEPNQKFIGSLRKRLEEEASQDRSHRIAVSFLTVAVGLVGGLVIFLIGQIFIRGRE